jgi:hypothetical protein
MKEFEEEDIMETRITNFREKKNRVVLTTLLFCAFIFNSQALNVKSWTGSTNADFNTGTNWNPTGVPSATDSCVISLSASRTITLSNSITIGALNMIISGNNNALILDAVTHLLTIEGNFHMKAISGNSNTFIRLDCGASSGGVTIGRHAFLDDGGTRDSWVIADATSPGFLTFKGNVTIGALAQTSPTIEPDIVFDGTGTQTITINNTSSFFLAEDLMIGNVNNPTVNLTGATVNGFGCYDGTVSVKGTSILNLGGFTINRIASSGGTFTVEAGATIKIGTTRTFPSNYSTYNVNATSNTYYDGTNQTIAANVAYGNLYLEGSGTKTLNSTGTINGNLIASGVTLDANASMNIKGNVNLNNATFLGGTAITHSIEGNWINIDGTFTPETSTIAFTGNSTKTIEKLSGSASVTESFYNLTVNKTGGATLDLASIVSISNSLTFTNGIITSTNDYYPEFGVSATVSGTPSATTHVNGPVHKLTNSTTTFTFPVGDGATYRSIGITPSSTGATTWRAKYNSATYATLDVTAPLDHVSSVEYWDLDRISGVETATITLSWDANSGDITDYTKLVVAHFNSSTWENAGGNAHTGNNTAGTVQSNAAWNNYSPFTIGSTDPGNALPVTMLEFNGLCQTDHVRLFWQTASELNSSYFDIERSIEGYDWKVIESIEGSGNTSSTTDYEWKDYTTIRQNTPIYYRLRQFDFDGKEEIHGPISISCDTNEKMEFTIYPNPTQDKTTIQIDWIKGKDNLLIVLSDASGKILQEFNTEIKNGINTIPLELTDFNNGMYFITLKNNYEQIGMIKVVKQ